MAHTKGTKEGSITDFFKIAFKGIMPCHDHTFAIKLTKQV